MTADQIAALFTRADGGYAFARWGRPIAPVVFGVEAETLAVIKAAIETVVTLARHEMAEADAELGANLMLFFCRDWAELPQVPNLDRMIPGITGLCDRLAVAGANQYRCFRFDDRGAIKAAFGFVRMDADLSVTRADVIAMAQAVQSILLWSDGAFTHRPALSLTHGLATPHPDIAAVIRAAYDPAMPMVATDPSHALRLAARVSVQA